MSKHDIFTKMTERRDIVDFVKEVERHKCLYDHTSSEYSNRVFTRRAWLDIATNSNSTVPECKEKWRKIRIAFIRSLKQNKSGFSSRPYYLAEHLKFIVPFMKINEDGTNNTPSSPPTTNSEEDHIEITDVRTKTEKVSTLDSNSEDESNSEGFDSIFVDNYKSRKNDVRFRKRRYQEEKNEDSPRKMFLLSILPDVEAFSEKEMRIFRRNVINTIDNIVSVRN